MYGSEKVKSDCDRGALTTDYLRTRNVIEFVWASKVKFIYLMELTIQSRESVSH